MTNLTFRRATRADLEAIVDLLVDGVVGATREEVRGHSMPNMFPHSKLSRLGMWRGQIESVLIKSTKRCGGLDHKMFAWAIEQCRAKGCELVQLATDKSRADTLRFYESLGFKASHEGMKLEL